MSHPIEQRIATLRRRVRRLVLLHGLSATVGRRPGRRGAAGALRLLDPLPGSRHPRPRLARRAGGLRLDVPAVSDRAASRPAGQRRSGRCDWSGIFPPWTTAWSAPSSSCGSRKTTRIAGSAALRRAVIAETTAATDRLDFTDALDRGPPLRAGLIGPGRRPGGRRPGGAESRGLRASPCCGW